MANETVAYIADMVDDAGDLDVTNVYDQAWPISQAIFDKINKRASRASSRDPATDELQNYGVDPRTGPGGTLSAYSDSKEVDWMVHCYIGEFKKAFVNVHITAGSARTSTCRTSAWRGAPRRVRGSTSTTCCVATVRRTRSTSTSTAATATSASSS